MMIDFEEVMTRLEKLREDNAPDGWETPVMYNLKKLKMLAIEECMDAVKDVAEVVFT